MIEINYNILEKECRYHFEDINDAWCNHNNNKRQGFYDSCCQNLCPLSQNEKIKILKDYKDYKKDLHNLNNEIDSMISKINTSIENKQFPKDMIESIIKLEQVKSIINKVLNK